MNVADRSSLNQVTTFGGLSRSSLMARIRSSGNASTELRMVSLFTSEKLVGWRRNFPLAGKPDFVFRNFRLSYLLMAASGMVMNVAAI